MLFRSIEEETNTMTFHVMVVKKGTANKKIARYEDENTPIEVEENSKFEITLESNPTTGYSWQLAEPLDESILELVSSEYEKKTGSETAGSPGVEVWTFLASGAGSTRIDFIYVRSWEKDAAPESEKTFSVTVKPIVK